VPQKTDSTGRAPHYADGKRDDRQHKLRKSLLKKYRIPTMYTRVYPLALNE